MPILHSAESVALIEDNRTFLNICTFQLGFFIL